MVFDVVKVDGEWKLATDESFKMTLNLNTHSTAYLSEVYGIPLEFLNGVQEGRIVAEAKPEEAEDKPAKKAKK